MKIQETSAFARARRASIRLAAGLVAIAVLAPLAQADTYPTKPLRIVVGSPPGALGDVLARVSAQHMGTALGQPIVVDNKPGASLAIAADTVAKAPADGYTLLIAPDSATVVNPFLYPKLPYDPVKDFRSVGLVGKASLVLVVANSLKIDTVEQLVQAAKAKPDSINFGSGGAGHPTHLAMEMFANRMNIKLTHVPYKGTSPAIQGLITGEIGAMIVGVAEALPLITAGRIKPIAASGPQAKEKFPALPELRSFNKDLDLSVWFGIFAPKATPQSIIDRLNTELNRTLALPQVRAKLDDYGMLPQPGKPAALDAIQELDRSRYGPLVKSLGLKVD
jgi:tripartite-type tricarboxylate transporter receptor subunit TctC